MRKLTKTTEPGLLADNYVSRTDDYIAWHSLPTDSRSADDGRTKAYNKPPIKAALIQETHSKCAYCEWEAITGSDGDIEHILPKSQRPDLFADWGNLTLGCRKCNRKKSDYYDESAMLIHPYEDEPRQHLFFAGSFAIQLSAMGQRSIDEIGLNRDELISKRHRHLGNVRLIVEMYRDFKEPYKEQVRLALLDYLTETQEFTLMVHDYLVAEIPEMFAPA